MMKKTKTNKELSVWWSFVMGVIIGMIIMGISCAINLSHKGIIPKAEEGTFNFVHPNVPHCSKSCNRVCFVEQYELDHFKQEETWKTIIEYGSDYVLIYR